MFTAVELDYLVALLNTYKKQGYEYYMAHTVSDGSEYDFCVYISKNEIKALNDNYFDCSQKDTLKILVDSSPKSSYNAGSRNNISSFRGNVTVDTTEFIYSNAIHEYSSTIVVNPDIMIDYRVSHVDIINLFIIVIIFGFLLVSKLLNIGGK